MTDFLLIGSALGALIGFFHAWRIYAGQVETGLAIEGNGASRVRLRAFYSALWTWALWTIFGSYLFALWLISIVIYVPFKMLKPARSSEASA